jgi:hypothetical protein
MWRGRTRLTSEGVLRVSRLGLGDAILMATTADARRNQRIAYTEPKTTVATVRAINEDYRNLESRWQAPSHSRHRREPCGAAWVKQIEQRTTGVVTGDRKTVQCRSLFVLGPPGAGAPHGVLRSRVTHPCSGVTVSRASHRGRWV